MAERLVAEGVLDVFRGVAWRALPLAWSVWPMASSALPLACSACALVFSVPDIETSSCSTGLVVTTHLLTIPAGKPCRSAGLADRDARAAALRDRRGPRRAGERARGLRIGAPAPVRGAGRRKAAVPAARLRG